MRKLVRIKFHDKVVDVKFSGRNVTIALVESDEGVNPQMNGDTVDSGSQNTPEPTKPSGKIEVSAKVTNITKNTTVEMSRDVRRMPVMKVSKGDRMKTEGFLFNGTNKKIVVRIEDWLGITLLNSIGRDDPNQKKLKEFFIEPNKGYTFTSEWTVPPYNFGRLERIDGANEILGFQIDYKLTPHHFVKMKLEK